MPLSTKDPEKKERLWKIADKSPLSSPTLPHHVSHSHLFTPDIKTCSLSTWRKTAIKTNLFFASFLKQGAHRQETSVYYDVVFFMV